MSQKFEGLKLKLDEDLAERLERLVPSYSGFNILKESIDARRRHEIHRVLSVEVFAANEKFVREEFLLEKINSSGKDKPLIIGAGPAGLFAAIRLVERGIPCILLERGSEAIKRLNAINRFWRYGELDPDDNVCFGEGGAGLYSDGKLMTRVKSEYIPYIMRRLVDFGAPPEIEYLANPHVGSDKIRRVIPKLREYLQKNGCEIYFNSKVTEIMTEKNKVIGVKCGEKVFRSHHIILAQGHSATDMFGHLADIGVKLEGKSFALGLRIEHPQSFVNQVQYRNLVDHPKLKSANYKLAYTDPDSGTGIYSFCMCPGGYILSSGTDADGIVCNGMSNYHRNSPFANAGIVVSIDFQKKFKDKTFGGFEFQRDLERNFKDSVTRAGGTKQLPAQKALDFMNGKKGEIGKTSSPSGAIATRLDELLPKALVQSLREGLTQFESKMKGFLSPEAQLHGIESRTSSPIRIPRDPISMESLSHHGLYPVGEGAGYAGGITSAAADGIKAAEAIVRQMASQAVKA